MTMTLPRPVNPCSINHKASESDVILSVVVPCFNEDPVIANTHRRLVEVLKQAKCTWEIIYVDDGSSDTTPELLAKIHADTRGVQVVRFSRNFGHQIAVSAGLEYARGRAVVVIDADLQDPPEVILAMMERWRAGGQVIHGRRVQRQGETWFKRLTAAVFYRVLNRLSDVPIPCDVGDFRLMDRVVVNALLAMPERDRYLRGMVAWVGFRQSEVSFQRAAREAGETKYPLRKMISFASDGVMSFSYTPLRLATWLGLATCGSAICGAAWALYLRLFTDHWFGGWTLMFLAILFLGSVQLLCLGIIGEYVGRLYRESKKRPLFVVAEHLAHEGLIEI